MLGKKCDHPNDHEIDHTYPDTHPLADQGSNPCSLGSSKRGGRERSRGADTIVQTTLLGATSTGSTGKFLWERGKRSSLCYRAVLAFFLSHCIVMVMGLLQMRSHTIFFFVIITKLIIWTTFHIALLLILPLAQKMETFST